MQYCVLTLLVSAETVILSYCMRPRREERVGQHPQRIVNSTQLQLERHHHN